MDGTGRTLMDLNVKELRAELANRGLNQGGNKSELTERLAYYLRGENKDPEVFVFGDATSGGEFPEAPKKEDLLDQFGCMMSQQIGNIQESIDNQKADILRIKPMDGGRESHRLILVASRRGVRNSLDPPPERRRELDSILLVMQRRYGEDHLRKVHRLRLRSPIQQPIQQSRKTGAATL
ncbi:hypothetical protein J437_LFUL018504 [Ladona fulva]|uniref:SAP domain-containing protein n=1 Tax=Ladona fulva TaxID=123851 RepID=A0A8K0P9K6_LADFU|nr:hypothetical protein J437_LFUL018504 [Ladona fulva]